MIFLFQLTEHDKNLNFAIDLKYNREKEPRHGTQYSFKFYHMGKWYTRMVDYKLPVKIDTRTRYQRTLGTGSADYGELWSAYAEKAYAQVKF